jgi:phasin family protein
MPLSPWKDEGIMTKAATGTDGLFDMGKVFGNFRLPSFDVEAIAATQRKNLEALTQANQLAVEGVSALAERQVGILQQAIAEASGLFREWTQPGAADERLAKSVDAAKQTFEKGLANARELNDLSAKAGMDVFSVLARRLSQSFDEVRLYAKKQIAAH